MNVRPIPRVPAGLIALAVAVGAASALLGPSLPEGLWWPLRGQRLLAAAGVGALLALSGLALQVVLRNPLADPYVLGTSGGASVGALAALLLGASMWWGAGLGALACALALLALARPALMAVDEVGNMSGWGPSKTITLTQVGVDPAVIRSQVEEAIKNGEALSKATREEIVAAFAQMGRSSDIIESVWPPSRGTVGVSLWVSPDGRVFKCTKRGNKEE